MAKQPGLEFPWRMYISECPSFEQMQCLQAFDLVSKSLFVAGWLVRLRQQVTEDRKCVCGFPDPESPWLLEHQKEGT